MTIDARRQAWQVWDRDTGYGDLFYKRAVGQMPEMESSKAVARILKGFTHAGDTILDVGCGAGHYLRSLRREIPVPFRYVGVDATKNYVEIARQAWRNDHNAEFETANIFCLPFQDSACDIVMSCNVILHLPSIKAPLAELVRVAGKVALIRAMVGERSFRIQEVYSPATHPDAFSGDPDEEEFDEHGEPKSFHYFNIYSRAYIEKLISKMPGVAGYRIYADEDFDVARIDSEEYPETPPDKTSTIDGWQVNGNILMPWHFIEITKKEITKSGR